jgi:hypothetical protein
MPAATSQNASEPTGAAQPTAIITTTLAAAADRGERWATVDGSRCYPCCEIRCDGCGQALEESLVFAPQAISPALAPAPADEGSSDADASAASAAAAEGSPLASPLYCHKCFPSHLGPPCRGCGLPAPRKAALVAVDAWWHKGCMRCSEDSCRVPLGERYWQHERRPYCAEHFAARTAEPCGRCGEPVAAGLRALGRAWHEGCLRCDLTGVSLSDGTAYMQVRDGR